MARKKVQQELNIKSWQEVDDSLKRIAECERVLDDMTNNMNYELDQIKEKYAAMAKPVQERIGHLETDISEFVTVRRSEIPGKTMVLNFGQTGFRIASKIKYKQKAPEVVAALLRLGLRDCVKTTQTVIADALKRKPVDTLEAVGAYIERKDEFWYEVTREALQTPEE